eukprot:SAG31_NODE_7742_length_1602_cov_1.715139_3_plen_112_part_00
MRQRLKPEAAAQHKHDVMTTQTKHAVTKNAAGFLWQEAKGHPASAACACACKASSSYMHAQSYELIIMMIVRPLFVGEKNLRRKETHTSTDALSSSSFPSPSAIATGRIGG